MTAVEPVATPTPAPATVHRNNVEWHAGRDAFTAGKSLDDCPYTATGERAARWSLGWQEARAATPDYADPITALRALVGIIDHILVNPDDVLDAEQVDAIDNARAVIAAQPE